MSSRNPCDAAAWTSWWNVKSEAQPAEARDDVLVARAMKGDLSAFRELVERYQQRVHSVALGVMGNFEDAEDVTQDAFLKAYKNLSSFRGQSSFYTWVYRIAFNLAIDEKRRRYRHVETNVSEMSAIDVAAQDSKRDGTSILSDSPRPDAELERSELRGQIAAAMAELSPEHRAVIVLREVEGLSYAEISDAVGCSKGTVMSRLHHARRRLKKALERFSAGEAAGESD